MLEILYMTAILAVTTVLPMALVILFLGKKIRSQPKKKKKKRG